MQKQLQKLQEVLIQMDNNPQFSTMFFRCQDKKEQNISKFRIISDTLHEVHHSFGLQDCVEISTKTKQILDNLSVRYQSNQHLTWPSHVVHFHVCMKDWINCPMTCLG
jgi:alkyl hydroperoxide reductase subunit AhpC